MKHSELKQLIREEIMIAYQEGRKIKDSFNKLLSDINSAQFIKLSERSMNALENIRKEIEQLKS